MKPYTYQYAFNTVATHLFTQGRRAVENDVHIVGVSSCLYRAPDGTKCAIGCLIKDEDYSEKMEGRDVENLRYREMLPEYFQPLDTEFLTALQMAHDILGHWDSYESMKDSLRNAARFSPVKLDTSILDKLFFK